jgi:hypothetical protein
MVVVSFGRCKKTVRGPDSEGGSDGISSFFPASQYYQGVPRAIFPQIICRLRVRKFLFASTLACERKIFWVVF